MTSSSDAPLARYHYILMKQWRAALESLWLPPVGLYVLRHSPPLGRLMRLERLHARMKRPNDESSRQRSPPNGKPSIGI